MFKLLIANMKLHTARVIRKTGPQVDAPTLARKTLAENMRRICRARGLNSTDIGRLSGVSQRAVHDMLLGTRSSGIDNICKVAISLGLSTWQLLVSPPDIRAFELWEIYNISTPEGRALMDTAAETAERLRKTRGVRQHGERSSWPDDAA